MAGSAIALKAAGDCKVEWSGVCAEPTCDASSAAHLSLPKIIRTASLLASFPFDDAIARDSAFASPNNDRAAPIDSELAVQ
jgi:hypothetical protein